MAQVRLNILAAESCKLPHVCLCCGAPSTTGVTHRFYYDPTWLATIGMLLPWYIRYHFASQSLTFPVPVCARHTRRLVMPTYLGMLFALLLIVLAPLAVAAHHAGMTVVRDLMAVSFIFILPTGLLGLMLYRVMSPRMVDYDTRTALLVNVAPEFAEAVEGRKLPGLPGLNQPGRTAMGSGANWLLIGGVCGGLAVLMLSCGGMVLVAAALSRGNRGANAAQLRASAERQMAEAKANMERARAENEARRQQMIAERSARANNWPTPPAAHQPANTPPVPPSPPPAPPSAANVGQSSSDIPAVGFPPTPRAGFDPRNRVPRPGMGGIANQEQREQFRPGRGGQFPPDSRPAGDAAALQAGQRVWVNWGGTWYRSVVLSTEPQAARVHYLGWSDGFDRSVPLADIRVTTEAAAAPAVASGDTAPPRSRTWTDATGQFKVDAELVELQGNTVVLKKADGASVRIPLDRLSAEDQRIAQEFK